jgi:L-asparagine oxygenase
MGTFKNHLATQYNNVFPVAKHRAKQSSESSDVLLTYHTENCFHSIQPDYLLLLCLRPDRYEQAKTCIASVRNVVDRISSHTRTALESPIFQFFSDYKGTKKDNCNDIELVQSVLYGDPNDPFIRFDPTFMKPLNADAENAMRELEHVVTQVGHQIALGAGDVILIDNRRSAHARTAFKAHYDGTDRWLQRIFVSKDYISKVAHLHNRKERIVTTSMG